MYYSGKAKGGNEAIHQSALANIQRKSKLDSSLEIQRQKVVELEETPLLEVLRERIVPGHEGR